MSSGNTCEKWAPDVASQSVWSSMTSCMPSFASFHNVTPLALAFNDFFTDFSSSRRYFCKDATTPRNWPSTVDNLAVTSAAFTVSFPWTCCFIPFRNKPCCCRRLVSWATRASICCRFHWALVLLAALFVAAASLLGFLVALLTGCSSSVKSTSTSSGATRLFSPLGRTKHFASASSSN